MALNYQDIVFLLIFTNARYTIGFTPMNTSGFVFCYLTPGKNITHC